jgi:hypothetical protein
MIASVVPCLRQHENARDRQQIPKDGHSPACITACGHFLFSDRVDLQKSHRLPSVIMRSSAAARMPPVAQMLNVHVPQLDTSSNNGSASDATGFAGVAIGIAIPGAGTPTIRFTTWDIKK